MLTGFVFAVSIMVSTMVIGSDAYLGEDLTDEDFESFVDAHADILDDVSEFIKNNRAAFETGAIGGLTGLAIKGISSNPLANALLIGGGVELAKTLYKNSVSGNAPKQAQIDELERKLEAVLKEMNQMKASSGNQPTVGDFTCGHGHELRSENTNRNDPRSSYNIGHHTYTTNRQDAGPHRDGYREYRDPSTREIRDLIDRIYRDSTRDRNYVEASED